MDSRRLGGAAFAWGRTDARRGNVAEWTYRDSSSSPQLAPVSSPPSHHSPLGLAVVLALLVFPEMPRARVRAFLLGGQSNMVGYGRQDDLPSRADVPGVWIWSAAYGRSGTWQPLGPGFGRNDSCFGPELSLGSALAEILSADTVVLLKTAIGGTSLAEEWRPPSRGTPGIFYPYLRIWHGLASDQWPWQGSAFPALSGVFWLQGESDALDSAMAASYAVNLQSFIEDVRNDWQDSSLPWVVGMLDSTTAWIHVAQIRTAQRLVASNVPRVALVETIGLSDDGAHFDSRGLTDLGRMFAEAWLALAKEPLQPVGMGKTPWAGDRTSPSRSGSRGEWGRDLAEIPEGSHVRWLDSRGRTTATWILDRQEPPSPRTTRGVGVLLIRHPGGSFETRRVPPAFSR